MLFLTLLVLSTATIISIITFSVNYGISPMPSNRRAVAAILAQFSPDFQGKIYDLGSGFGTLAYAFARHFPNATIIGFEVSPIPYFLSKVLFRRKNLTYLRKDFFKVDLLEADGVVCYLYPGAMEKLEERPWRMLVTNTFALPTQKASQTIALGDLFNGKVYCYTPRCYTP
ncbi:MAG: hypothetical protein S4CHLAM45_07070 [Chlamydiales bacterium]|nr:hypothetical protein [Chlamydiales bacterium]MCH9620275.1 hypothetical protein [Chlamydiales bacterium]MCH9622814.1 hypothetical protein [Chlamydiales bacterium]